MSTSLHTWYQNSSRVTTCHHSLPRSICKSTRRLHQCCLQRLNVVLFLASPTMTDRSVANESLWTCLSVVARTNIGSNCCENISGCPSQLQSEKGEMSKSMWFTERSNENILCYPVQILENRKCGGQCWYCGGPTQISQHMGNTEKCESISETVASRRMPAE